MPLETTIRLPTRVRDRLRRYGLKGQSYAEILGRLMDRVDRDEFLDEQTRLLDEAIRAKDSLSELRTL